MHPLSFVTLACLFSLSSHAGEFHGDGRITGPGVVEYLVERAGAPKEDLRVQALIVGHGRGGSIEELLLSEPFEVIPSTPSKTELQVSEENFREWNKRFDKITAALRVAPRPDGSAGKVTWEYKNLLDPGARDSSASGRFRVHGRWVAR